MFSFPRHLHNLYKFEDEGELYVADLVRGMVVQVDTIILDILDLCSEYTTDQILKLLAGKYSYADICNRIDQLKRFDKLGLLFSEDKVDKVTLIEKEKGLKIFVTPGALYKTGEISYTVDLQNRNLIDALIKHTEVNFYLPMKEESKHPGLDKLLSKEERVTTIPFNDNRILCDVTSVPSDCDVILSLTPLDLHELSFYRYASIPVVTYIQNESLINPEAINALLARCSASREFDLMVTDASWLVSLLKPFLRDDKVFHVVLPSPVVDFSEDINAAKTIVANALGETEIAAKPMVGVSSSCYPRRILETIECLSLALSDITFIGIGSDLEYLARILSKAFRCFGIQNTEDLATIPLLFRALDALIFHLEPGASTFCLFNAMSCGTTIIMVGPKNASSGMQDVTHFVEWEKSYNNNARPPLENIISKIAFIISHPAEKTMFGEKSRKFAVSHTWQQLAHGLYGLIKRAISAKESHLWSNDKPHFLFTRQYNKAIGVIENTSFEIPGFFRCNIRDGIASSLSRDHEPWEVKVVLDYLSKL